MARSEGSPAGPGDRFPGERHAEQEQVVVVVVPVDVVGLHARSAEIRPLERKPDAQLLTIPRR